METAGHVYRIGNACACMGGLPGWDDSRIRTVRWAVPLHDIGKIGISDAILSKPGPLTAGEFEIIKRHTVKGARILANSQNKTISMGEILALSQHENWDGSGYPQGLKGGNIPPEACAVAIVDVHDALLTDRVYRKGMPKERALEIIADGAGKKFAPDIATLFIKHNSVIHRYLRDSDTDIKPWEERCTDRDHKQTARHARASGSRACGKHWRA